MHTPRIFLNQELSEQQQITLEPEASHHLVTVLRIKQGRKILLFNGQGGEFSAQLVVANKRAAVVAIDEFADKNNESPLSIHLGICLIKNDRFDWLLQKATELGVTTITPLISQYTDNKIPSEKLPKKIKHWENILVNAAEQSERTLLPPINPPQKLKTWQEERREKAKFILHPSVSGGFDKAPQTFSSAALLVGPEGGFSEEEVATSTADGFVPVSLGPRILRAETAPLAAISLLQYRYGDMG